MTLEMLGGFEVDTAAGGERCIAPAKQRRPDLIVLDARMPGMDGPTTFRALAADPATRRVPVVFLTGAERGSTDADAIDDLPHGGVVRKPFTSVDLIGTVRRALRGGAGPRENR